jgi:hypothetical protein
MDLREIGKVAVDWIYLAQWRALVNTVNVGKFYCSCGTDGFSRRSQLHRVS